MSRKTLNLSKITNNKWLNLFKVKYVNSKNKVIDWFFASRKDEPFNDDRIDAVIIIPFLNTSSGRKLVMIKEYRIAIQDWEYGFPAGIIENEQKLSQTVKTELKEETGLNIKKIVGKSNILYSSAGLSDESCVIVFVETEGEVSAEYQEDTEDIEVLLCDINDIKKILSDSTKKIGAKAWGILHHYSKTGEID